MEAIILNTSFEAIKIIDEFESFIWTDRYSEYGDFELYIPIDNNDIFTYVKDGYYVVINDSDHVMIVEDIRINTDTEDSPQLNVVGRSLESILDRRIVWKQTVINGNLQSGIKKLLDENVILPEDDDRKIDNFVFEASDDPYITSLTIDAQFTGDNLYDVIKIICDTYNLGFSITLSSEGKFIFKLYSGVDRSYDQFENQYVIFSPSFENLLNSSYLESKKNLKTVTLVAGEGEGIERKTLSVSSADGSGVGLDRRELYTDAKDISKTVDGGTLTDEEYEKLLLERGNEKLSECVAIKSFEGESDPNITYKYGEDYFIGDIVQIENEYGIMSRSRVTEIIYSESSSGVEIYPTFTKVE